MESPKVVRVRTPREEFEAAANNGYVFGKLVRQSPLPTYIELGTEREYISSAKDDPNTEYRYFVNCNVLVAKTEQQLDREEYIAEWMGVAVIIYC